MNRLLAMSKWLSVSILLPHLDLAVCTSEILAAVGTDIYAQASSWQPQPARRLRVLGNVLVALAAATSDPVRQARAGDSKIKRPSCARTYLPQCAGCLSAACGATERCPNHPEGSRSTGWLWSAAFLRPKAPGRTQGVGGAPAGGRHAALRATSTNSLYGKDRPTGRGNGNEYDRSTTSPWRSAIARSAMASTKRTCVASVV